MESQKGVRPRMHASVSLTPHLTSRRTNQDNSCDHDNMDAVMVKTRGLLRKGECCYAMENADEYWAEGTQAWFEATTRTGRSPLGTEKKSGVQT
eukprot:scaffold321232_cov17-Tisochrysis_lutea.AAC.1